MIPLIARKRPSLDLSFLGASLMSVVTFTRADAATCATLYNAAGTLTTVAANVARFDYDPVTLLPKGLLIEESRTNLLLRSEAFDNAAWTKNAGSATADQTAAPDGNSTADFFKEDNTTAQHDLVQVVTAANNQPIAFSVFGKANGRSRIRMMCDKDSGFVDRIHAEFDLTGSGAVSNAANFGTGANAAGAIQKTPNSWFRGALTGQPSTSAGTTIRCVAYLETGSNTTIYAGDNASGVYCWGAQIEAAAFPTSYIATAGSAVTRAADVATITRAGVTLGSVSVKGYTARGAGTQVLWQWDDGSENNRLTLYRDSSNAIHFVVVSGGVTQADITLSTVAANTEFSVAAAWNTNDIAATLNGGTVGTDSSATIPTGLTTIRLGASSAATSWNGTMERLRQWDNARLSNTLLQNLASGA
jgi:hypothetical protein